MFKRNKKDKGKKSQEARMKISQALKGKAKKIRAKASDAARKGIIKGAGAAGYATGRVGTEIATRPRLAKAVGKAAGVVEKVANKLPASKNSVLNKKGLPKTSLRNQITATRATGSFIGGGTKGVYAGLSAAGKREKRKS